MSSTAPLVDSLGRVHTSLRISVTDRCNIRCFYCMPEVVRFLPREEILSFEEIERFVRVLAPLGVNKLRLTGGEPLVRSGLPGLVERLAAIEGIEDIALTTNGILLEENAVALKNAGLQRVNISLDALTE
ncbi:MAG: radical SAM protein, partial [Planctomycetales bacterium]|nr:radical SAM protein [Planctomycetales bacterium]